MSIIFATFHVDLSSDATSDVLSLEPNFVRHEPKELIQALFASVRYHHPDSRTVILTDQTTQFPFQEDRETYRFDFDSQYPILSRTQAQLQFLKNQNVKSHIVFLDSDMLVQTCLNDVFAKPFDVGLTYRPGSMPINGAFICVNQHGYAAASHFFEKMLELMTTEFKTFQAWYGDQLALAKMVPVPPIVQEEEILFSHAEIRFLLLPASQYNFTTSAKLMNGDYSDKKILHFKGTRKRFMLPYSHIKFNIPPDFPL